MGKWEVDKKSTEKARQSVVSQKFLCAARGCPPEGGGGTDGAVPMCCMAMRVHPGFDFARLL